MTASNIRIGGGVVFFTTGATSRSDLDRRLDELGLRKFVPDLRPPTAVLKDALTDVMGNPTTLIRPLSQRDGFVVVKETRGSEENGYTTELKATVLGQQPPKFSPDWHPEAQRVAEKYASLKDTLTGSQVSAALVKLVDYLGGVRLRPNGSVYWVPGDKVEEWAKVSDAVEACALPGETTCVYLVRHELDEDATRAVHHAIIHEVRAEAATIKAEVETGELGARALETRHEQARRLLAKIGTYEDILSVGLADLKRVVESAEQATATAELLLAATASAPAEVHEPAGVN